MSSISPHAWLEPKLVALLGEAQAAGIERDVSVAVITDLVNGKLSAALPAPDATNPDQDIGEPDYMVPHGQDASLKDTGEVVGNPLDHVGHNRWGR